MQKWAVRVTMAVACVCTAMAQQSAGRGGVTGSVIDPQYMEVEGATVSLAPGGLSSQTSSSGQFAFNGVPAGNYTVTVHAKNYREWKAAVKVKANESTSVHAALTNEQ